MNGFGIEQADSYNIYNSKLMPNLDSYTQKYLFSSIDSNEYNFIDGYRMFSIGSKYPLTYSLIKNYMENFEKNSNMNFYLSNIIPDSKIQLFMFIEDEKNLEHLKYFLKFIRTKYNNPIFLHIVLTSADLNNYKDLEHIVTKISYDYKDCKVGTVIGKNILCGNDLVTYMNMLKNEVGEKWREISRKFNSLVTSKTAPFNMKEFYMNEGFKINDNDTYFFFNYEYADITNLVTNINSLSPNSKYFSMFPLKGVKFPMFAYPLSSKSMTNSLKTIDCKALILSNPIYMPYINYMVNGLNNAICDNIFYSRTDTNFGKKKIQDIINNSNYDLIVIDYHIDNVSTVKELTDRLSNLDSIIGVIHDTCVENKISLFISSLYGMKKELSIDNFMKAFINFSSKVPVLVIDPIFNKENFRLDFGNVYNLAHTIYTNMNNKYNDGEVLIKRKGYLSKMIKK